jgi:hypothetical protein
MLIGDSYQKYTLLTPNCQSVDSVNCQHRLDMVSDRVLHNIPAASDERAQMIALIFCQECVDWFAGSDARSRDGVCPSAQMEEYGLLRGASDVRFDGLSCSAMDSTAREDVSHV